MTNFERWQSFMSGFVSPQNYIDFGFYSMIGAALQRRVWIGPDHSRCFPNDYIILVGEAGIGKGLVIKKVAEFIKHHTMSKPGEKKPENTTTQTDQDMLRIIEQEDYEYAEKLANKKADDSAPRTFEKPLLFPVAADATTYEALVRAMSRSIRRINYLKEQANGEKKMEIYTHSSLYFCLEEISSLFRKRTEDIVHFLLQAYDCGDYEYDTKTQGKDRIRKCCLSLFGGTTPSFMQSTFTEQLFDEGFSSRTKFIYAQRNRKTSLFIPDLSSEQLRHKQEILVHLQKLSSLYGRVHVDDLTLAWLENWWRETNTNGRPNRNIKLNPYYARKNVHLFKLAMAVHFGDSLEMHIPKATFEKALDILANEERNMHLALGLDKANPLATPAKRIHKYIEATGPKTRKELLAEFWSSLPKGANDLDEILEYLLQQNKLRTVEKRNGEIVQVKYDLIPE